MKEIRKEAVAGKEEKQKLNGHGSQVKRGNEGSPGSNAVDWSSMMGTG